MDSFTKFSVVFSVTFLLAVVSSPSTSTVDVLVSVGIDATTLGFIIGVGLLLGGVGISAWVLLGVAVIAGVVAYLQNRQGK